MFSYNVYLNGKLIDTVYSIDKDKEDVRRSLINHDGYDANIRVVRVKQIRVTLNCPLDSH